MVNEDFWRRLGMRSRRVGFNNSVVVVAIRDSTVTVIFIIYRKNRNVSVCIYLGVTE